MSLRIVAGRHRGRRLRTLPGLATRPTGERAREALFAILETGRPPLRDSRFLDLFAGSGAVGLEALSRGAGMVLLVERSAAALRLIEANIATLGESARARPHRADASRLGRALGTFDIAFLDPPYGGGLLQPALGSLVAGGWLAPEALVIAELALGEALTPPPGLVPEDERRYGAARFVFLRHAAAAHDQPAR